MPPASRSKWRSHLDLPSRRRPRLGTSDQAVLLSRAGTQAADLVLNHSSMCPSKSVPAADATGGPPSKQMRHLTDIHSTRHRPCWRGFQFKEQKGTHSGQYGSKFGNYKHYVHVSNSEVPRPELESMYINVRMYTFGTSVHPNCTGLFIMTGSCGVPGYINITLIIYSTVQYVTAFSLCMNYSISNVRSHIISRRTVQITTLQIYSF